MAKNPKSRAETHQVVKRPRSISTPVIAVSAILLAITAAIALRIGNLQKEHASEAPSATPETALQSKAPPKAAQGRTLLSTGAKFSGKIVDSSTEPEQTAVVRKDPFKTLQRLGCVDANGKFSFCDPTSAAPVLSDLMAKCAASVGATCSPEYHQSYQSPSGVDCGEMAFDLDFGELGAFDGLRIRPRSDNLNPLWPPNGLAIGSELSSSKTSTGANVLGDFDEDISTPHGLCETVKNLLLGLRQKLLDRLRNGKTLEDCLREAKKDCSDGKQFWLWYDPEEQREYVASCDGDRTSVCHNVVTKKLKIAEKPHSRGEDKVRRKLQAEEEGEKLDQCFQSDSFVVHRITFPPLAGYDDHKGINHTYIVEDKNTGNIHRINIIKLGEKAVILLASSPFSDPFVTVEAQHAPVYTNLDENSAICEIVQPSLSHLAIWKSSAMGILSRLEALTLDNYDDWRLFSTNDAAEAIFDFTLMLNGRVMVFQALLDPNGNIVEVTIFHTPETKTFPHLDLAIDFIRNY